MAGNPSRGGGIGRVFLIVLLVAAPIAVAASILLERSYRPPEPSKIELPAPETIAIVEEEVDADPLVGAAVERRDGDVLGHIVARRFQDAAGEQDFILRLPTQGGGGAGRNVLLGIGHISGVFLSGRIPTLVVGSETGNPENLPDAPGGLDGSDRRITHEIVRKAIEEQARQARVVIQASRSMLTGRTHPLHLWLEHRPDKDEESQLDAALRSMDMVPVLDAAVKIAPEAAATLEGENFGIKLLSPENQLSVPTGRWSWEVVPGGEGRASLIVTLKHHVTVPGARYLVAVSHYPQTIDVREHPFDKVLRLFGAVASFFTSLTGMLTAGAATATLVGGWFLRFRKRGAPGS